MISGELSGFWDSGFFGPQWDEISDFKSFIAYEDSETSS
jgi:hypothetical protein